MYIGNGMYNVYYLLDCDCSDATSFVNLPCDHVTGQCHCKDVFTGQTCDECPRMTTGNPQDQDGCISKLKTLLF